MQTECVPENERMKGVLMAKKQFLYENVYYDLKQKIQCGELKPGDKLEVEGDMVSRYGVSAITVKKALNLLTEEGLIRRVRGKGSFVTQETEDPGTGLREAEMTAGPAGDPIIGVVFEHVSSSYGLQIMYELEQQARKAGYHLYPCFSYGNRELETEAIRYLRRTGARGIFVMPSHGSHYNTEILRLVIDRYPTVLIDKKLEGISLDSVRTDNVQSVSRLVEYLVETGKKHIGFITVEETGTSSLAERNEGFSEGMARYELEPVEKLSLPYIDYAESSDTRGDVYRKLIDTYIEKFQDRLDGIVCSEYGVAIEVQTVLEEKHLLEKMEACCIDENYIGARQYRMTHIKQDEQGIAQCAMRIMLEKMNGDDREAEDHLIPGKFRERKK